VFETRNLKVSGGRGQTQRRGSNNEENRMVCVKVGENCKVFAWIRRRNKKSSRKLISQRALKQKGNKAIESRNFRKNCVGGRKEITTKRTQLAIAAREEARVELSGGNGKRKGKKKILQAQLTDRKNALYLFWGGNCKVLQS